MNNKNKTELKPLWTTPDQGEVIWGLNWSPNSKNIAIGTENGSLRIFDINIKKISWKLDLEGNLRAIDWSPDGKYIAITNGDGRALYIIDVNNHEKIWGKKIHFSSMCGVAWDPNNKYIAVGTYSLLNSRLYLFKKTGEQLWVSDKQPGSSIWYIAWSHNGDKIAFNGGIDGKNVIIYSKDGNEFWSYETKDRILSIDWSPDDQYLAVGSYDNHVYVFDSNGHLLWGKDLKNHVYNVAWSPDGEYLAASGQFGTVLFAKNGKQFWINKDIKTYWSVYTHGNLEWSKYGLLVIGGYNAISKQDKLFILDKNGHILAETQDLGGRILRIAISPDETKIATVGTYKKLYVFPVLSVFLSEFIDECVDIIIIPTATPSNKFEITISVRNKMDNTINDLYFDFSPSKDYLKLYGLFKSHYVIRFPPIYPKMELERKIVARTPYTGRIVIPYRICIGDLCVDKSTQVVIGKRSIRESKSEKQTKFSFRRKESVSYINKSLTGIEEYLEKKLSSLEGRIACSGEWLNIRLVRGIVSEKYTGSWDCCKLGCGGWGCSYLCRRRDKEIVLKIPHGFEAIIEGGVPPSVHARMLRKIRERAEAIAVLSHPNILRLLGVGEQAPVLLYEFADYGTLDWQLGKGWEPGKRDLLLMFLQIADALRYIHGRGLVHGDVKPGNIFFVGRVAKLGDFSGLKKLLSITSSRSSLAGAYTVGFRAPEQVYRDLRVKAKKLGLEHMIDIYGLGNTILYTLTGSSIDGEEATEPEIVEEAVEEVEDEKLRGLLRKMLDPEPWNRPSSIEVVKTILAMLKEY